MALIDLATARAHLKVTDTSADITADLEMKMEQASAMVILYLKRPDHGWSSTTDPAEDSEFAIVQAAILKMLGHLNRWRGDDPAPRVEDVGDVMLLLSMLRDPTLA